MPRILTTFKILFYITLGCIMCDHTLHAQESDSAVAKARNAFFLEYGGNAANRNYKYENFSINYDRIIGITRLSRVSIRIGSNIPFKSAQGNSGHIVPVLLNVLIGKKNVFLEVGIGYEMIFIDSEYDNPAGQGTSVIGLRYQGDQAGLIVRLGIMPKVRFYNEYGALAGISLGYSF